VKHGNEEGNSDPPPLLPAGLREAQAAGIRFTHRSKIRFFATQERLVAPIHVKLGDVTWPTGTLIGAGGGNPAPKYQKFPLFGKGSPRFLNILGDFMPLFCKKFQI